MTCVKVPDFKFGRNGIEYGTFMAAPIPTQRAQNKFWQFLKENESFVWNVKTISEVRKPNLELTSQSERKKKYWKKYAYDDTGMSSQPEGLLLGSRKYDKCLAYDEDWELCPRGFLLQKTSSDCISLNLRRDGEASRTRFLFLKKLTFSKLHKSWLTMVINIILILRL